MRRLQTGVLVTRSEQRVKADEVPCLVHSDEEEVFVTAEFCASGLLLRFVARQY